MTDTVLTTDVKVDAPAVIVPPVVEPTKADIMFPAPKPEGEEAPKPDAAKDAAEKALADDKAKKEQEAKEATDKVAKEAADKLAAEKAAAYDLKAPEGVELDKESIKAYADIAKEAAVTSEQAQKLLDWYAKTSQEKGNAQMKVWEDTNKQWVDQAKTDKEYGGIKFDTSIKTAKAALAKFGNSEFTEALKLTGMGNHPEMVRFLVKVSSAIAEDKPASGLDGTKGDNKNIAKILFPDQN